MGFGFANDKALLESFFRFACSESWAGYVIFGTKPIVYMGYVEPERQGFPGHRLHEHGVYPAAIVPLLDKILGDKIIIRQYPKRRNDVYGFLIINKENLKRVFYENEEVFKRFSEVRLPLRNC